MLRPRGRRRTPLFSSSAASDVDKSPQSVTSFDRMLFKGLALNTTPHNHDRKGIAINNAVDAFDQSQPSHFVHGTGIDEKIIYNIFNFHGVYS